MEAAINYTFIHLSMFKVVTLKQHYESSIEQVSIAWKDQRWKNIS